MLVCLVLGMGIPTIPNYIITSAIAAPALLKLGVPLIVSHMFVFYFGIMADLTPPVALAAFAAASIAKASPMKIGWKATHIAIAGFVIPYMAVYDPALMLQTAPAGLLDDGASTSSSRRWSRSGSGAAPRSATCAARSTGPSASSRSPPPSLLVAALPLTDEIGFVASAAFVAWHWLRATSRDRGPRHRSPAATAHSGARRSD